MFFSHKATFQMLSSYRCLVAVLVGQGKEDIEHFHYHRTFYWQTCCRDFPVLLNGRGDSIPALLPSHSMSNYN
jgi:hypothetical protein